MIYHIFVMDKRAEIQSIQNDSSLSQAEKSKLIQNLFTPGVGQLEEVPGNPDELSCRICLETAKREELIAPCACAGSRKWIHRLNFKNILTMKVK